MNPSASGWITKLLKELSRHQTFTSQSEASLYCSLKESGFLYGNSKGLIIDFIESGDFTDEEMSKTNLLLALYFAHYKSDCKLTFLDSIIDFYKNIDVYKASFFSSIFNHSATWYHLRATSGLPPAPVVIGYRDNSIN